MIQVNLLPDVKTKYIVAQRKKRLVILSSVAISGVAIAILVTQFLIYGAQKWQLTRSEDDNKKNIASLQKVQDLNKILTIQNQIGTLNTLHNSKPEVQRIFTYLPQITPNDVQINKVNFSIADSTMTISGTAGSMESVNKFVDTLKFTKVVVDDGSPTPAFTTVVLSSFGNTDKGSSYDVNFKYDSSLFARDKKVTLQVPKIISTRSETEKPNPLFSQTENKGQ